MHSDEGEGKQREADDSRTISASWRMLRRSMPLKETHCAVWNLYPKFISAARIWNRTTT